MAWGRSNDTEAIWTIRAALDAGVNLIDTAENYGVDGHAERLVGEAIRGRRDRVVIATKVAPAHMTAERIQEALEGSLRRLNVDVIDLYQVHRYNPDIPLEETMTAMQQLREEGKVRAVGVCNFSADLLSKALEFGPLVTLQSAYNLLDRGIEREMLQSCSENDIGVLAHSTLAKNLLSGQIRRGDELPEDDIRLKLDELFKDGSYVHHLDVVEEIHILADLWGHPVYELAINWALQRPGITSVLVGMRRREHVEANIQALSWQLSQEQIERLNQLTSRYVTASEG
jgi:aryl-alcohol dehydrogenase-like predicted oxidoreductase